MPGRVRPFLAELRRRNVFKVTAAYAATAFVVWQATEIALPRLGLPEWSVTLVVVLTLVGLPVAVVLAWAYELTPAGMARTAPQQAGRAPGGDDRRVLPPANSLAVLPLRSLGSDPEGEFFAEGITEDIISHLAKIRDLSVISRTSSMRFRDTDLSISQIAAELGVRNILEGSVRRQAGSLRVSTNLVDAANDEHLWAQTFDRPWEDVFAVQSEIAASVAEALHGSLSWNERTALEQAPTKDLEAYRCVLEGRRRYDKGAIPESVHFFEEAARRDPEYADAFAWLAQAWMYTGQGYWGTRPREALPRVLSAAGRALDLDPTHADAMAILGFTEYIHHLHVKKACALIRDAVEMGQSTSLPHMHHAVVMSMMERHEEAVEAFEQAVAYDPFSATIHYNYVTILYLAGRHQEALRKSEWVREVFGPELIGFLAGMSMVELGLVKEALFHFQETAEAFGTWGFGRQMLAYGLACAGEIEEGTKLLTELQAREEVEYMWPMGYAFVHSALGHEEAALQRMEQSFDDRAGLIWIGAPAFKRLRSNPRYTSILARLGVEG